MIRPLVALCLALPLLAGCIGYAPGTLRPGSAVGFLYSSAGLGTPDCYAGAPFEKAPAAWMVGALGHRSGDTVAVTAADGVACHSLAVAKDELRREPRYQEVAFAIFREAAHADPEAGMTYTVTGRQGPVNLTVHSVNATTVSFEGPLPEPEPHPELGVDLFATVEGDQLVLRIRANVTGAIFAGPLPPFLTAPGNYTVVGQAGEDIYFAQQESHTLAHLAATSATIGLALAPDRPPSGNATGYGGRLSPWVGNP